MSETDLRLEVMEKGNILTPFSAREVIQTLTPIPQGTLRRTINGTLVCVGNIGHRKFSSTISCKDQSAPAFEGLWKGTLLKVGCVQALTHLILKGTKKIQLEREPLSLHFVDVSGKVWSAKKPKDRQLLIPNDFPGGHISYCPWLIMRVKNYQLETDEWGLTVGWTLELEEE
jgi:hypothetical protein